MLESSIAADCKKYFIKKYEAIKEYNILINPDTNYPLFFDIYLPRENIFIEINGKQHYVRNSFYNRTEEEFEYQKKKDRMKRKFARKNGTYIEVDLRKIKTTEDAIVYIENIINKL